MISGGVNPAGRPRKRVWAIAVIWATAISILAFGWKNTLMTPTPYMDCDSMCSMSLTVVVKARSVIVTTRFSISSGEIPVNDQITVTTGISTLGKISVDIRTIVTIPNATINNATTTNV